MNKHIRFVGLIIIAFSLALISSNAWAEVDLSIEKEHNPAAPCYQGSAYFYENSQFGGSKFSLNVGQGENRLSERRRGWPGQDKNWNDQLTSLKLSPCTIVTLYENDYLAWKKVYANTNHQTDMQINNVDAAWDNRVSSIKVQPYCGNDLCAYTPDELAQINEDISSVELSIEKEYSRPHFATTAVQFSSMLGIFKATNLN